MPNIAGPKVWHCLSLADTKNCNTAQVDVVLGIKFVEGAIPEKKVKRKADTEDSVLQGYKLMVAQLVIEIFSLPKVRQRLEICLFILSDGHVPICN